MDLRPASPIEFDQDFPEYAYIAKPEATVQPPGIHIKNDDVAQWLCSVYGERPWLAVKRVELFRSPNYALIFRPDITASHIVLLHHLREALQVQRDRFPEPYRRSWRLTAVMSMYLAGEFMRRDDELSAWLEDPATALAADLEILATGLDRAVAAAAAVLASHHQERVNEFGFDDFKVDFKREGMARELARTLARGTEDPPDALVPGRDDIALVIGIDGYETQPLGSCVADADAMRDLLARAGDAEGTPGYTVEKVAIAHGDLLPSRSEVLDKIVECLDLTADQDFIFYFSGHGASYDWGAELIVYDERATSQPESVGMQELLTLIHRSKVRQAVVILDCCYSGSFAVEPAFVPRPGPFEPAPSVLPPNFALLAASQPNLLASTGRPYSAFTELLVGGLTGGAADYNGGDQRRSGFGCRRASCADRPAPRP